MFDEHWKTSYNRLVNVGPNRREKSKVIPLSSLKNIFDKNMMLWSVSKMFQVNLLNWKLKSLRSGLCKWLELAVKDIRKDFNTNKISVSPDSFSHFSWALNKWFSVRRCKNPKWQKDEHLLNTVKLSLRFHKSALKGELLKSCIKA